MPTLYPPLYPEVLSVELYDEDLRWLQIKDGEENGFHDSMAPRKYRIVDYQGSAAQYQAIVTQKNQIGQPHRPFSAVTVYSYQALRNIGANILSYPDIRRMILLSPNQKRWDILGGDADSITIILGHFDTLQSLVMPVEFIAYQSTLGVLENHTRLVQLELVSPSIATPTNGWTSLELGLTFILGLSDLRHRLQKLIIPASLLSPHVLHFLGNMEHLKHLKIKSLSGSGGNHFVDMISEHNVSTEHAFHALRVLEVGVNDMHPSKLRILWSRFPDMQHI